ncbi:hypothetical protein Hypma_012004 [Hypsizygus marmoreus]|uniref:Uncharacterized protein n=1 Tax=Hypsizygus marmoreus TaxID=39966 RepID=A0A369JMI7_HYPMA|nr:hypothetical protein Hypma_012004 [Hypsizygus marmoreus]
MAKNRFSLHTKPQTPSPSTPSTVGAVVNPFHLDDDEDNDICPVCDGECTCNNRPRALPPPVNTPLTMSQLSALHAAGASRSNLSTPVPTPKTLLPSLKIKLTVPQSMLGKRRAPPQSSSNKSRNAAETTSVAENDGETFSGPSTAPGIHYLPQPAPLPPHPKRRGRPPKAAVVARQLAPSRSVADAHAAPTLQSSQSLKHGLPGKQKKPSARLPAPLKGRIVKKSAAAANKRRRVVTSESSDLSDVDHRYDFDDEDDDAQSVQFPTFVSASALSSRASSSSADSSELSSFDDSDDSIEAEEEKFILSEMQDRARVRRELLGEEGSKKRDPHNAWVIRPRKKSVGPSDVEMDVDSDATEDEDEEDEEECDDDEDETDGRGRPGAGYVGVATGWSEDDDESSFDADLFFANLSDSEAYHDDSTSSDDNDGDDGDHSDMESMEASIASLTAAPQTHQDNLAFEVTEGWDGQIVFTNGLSEGQGILDMDFEVHAAQFAETSASPSQESDIEMSSDDGGYEEDADEGEGETTDEELVGEDELPNERAMRLFSLPFSVSSINPMSTMSPAVSPGPRDRRPFGSRSVDSPKPADILSGKVFWDSDDHDEFEDSTTTSFSRSSSNGFGGGPRKGHFELVKENRQAIIDDMHKDVPSPHPRFRSRRSSFARLSHVEQILHRHLASQQSPITPSHHSPFQILPSTAEQAEPASEMANAEIVDLNDVLEASFLDADPSDPQNVSTENESRKQLKNFNRWDHISVGAFRQSRDTIPEGAAGWSSDTGRSNTDYGSMMKSSPLSTMLWQNKANQKRSRKLSVIISPVILPVRDRDGDRTPTNAPPNQPPPQQNHRYDNYPHKSRKELRRERKLKQKSYGPVHHQHQHNQHHSHHHHPNLKSRSSSSTQRSNFFMSSVPPLNL